MGFGCVGRDSNDENPDESIEQSPDESVSEPSDEQTDESKINWNDKDLAWFGYSEGMKEIEKTGKSGLLIFYADWCPSCKQHSKIFSAEKTISKIENLVLMRVNIDKDSELSDQYDFDGTYIPRVFALNPKGDVMHQLYDKKKEFAYWQPAQSNRQFNRLIAGMTKP